MQKNKCAPNILGSIEDHWTCFTLDELREIALAFNIYIQRNKICGIIDSNKVCIPEKLIKISNQTKRQLWTSIYRRLEPICKYEQCWVDLDFIKKIDDRYLQDKIRFFTFKPKMNGRLDSWLGTKDINAVLQQYQELDHDFKFLGALPSDFYKVTRVKWNDARKYKCLGIIFNLDDHTKSGSHWVAFFVDNVQKTIEYYDSVGSPPNKNIQTFINKIAKVLGKRYIIKINKIQHQYKNSECGIYAIYYIIRRLFGNDFETLTSTIINDEEMKQFRKIIFI